ncbi:16498_t:CDS:2 [Acaulospora morrowiae]|uniref:16498_t:CDS:1 n=1 Tax=Acaulospora morrowiae TaxID=94023 RepID=A0A9N9FYS9_9GLOM|nr:16498_t:CDS:2 [Acaulospora morrowiae]
MAPPHIPADCVEGILEFLEDDVASLHSCLLATRTWCKIAIPILWRQPFRRTRHKPSAALVETYWSFIGIDDVTQKDREALLEYKIEFSEPNRKKIFNYPSFIKRLNYRDLYDFAMVWYGDPETLQTVKPFRQDPMRTIARCLFNLFLSRGAKFDYLFWDNGKELIKEDLDNYEEEEEENVDLYSPQVVDDVFLELPPLPRSHDNFSNIRILGCFAKCENREQSFINAAASCQGIETLIVGVCMNDEWNTLRAQREMESLNNLINVQRHLKEFIFVEYPGTFWWSPSSRLQDVKLSLNSQVNTMTTVEFHHVDFEFWHPLESVANLTNLETLTFNNCRHQELVMEPFRYSSFHRLKRLVMNGYRGDSGTLVDLLYILVSHANRTLRHLSIVMTSETTAAVISAIQKYHHSELIELTIKFDHSHFISLLSCPFYPLPRLKKLVLSSWGFTEVIADDLLPQLGKSLPPSLVHLEILAPWKFSVEALKRFLENSHAPLKVLDIRYCREIREQHIVLIWNRLYVTLESLIISESKNYSRCFDSSGESKTKGESSGNAQSSGDDACLYNDPEYLHKNDDRTAEFGLKSLRGVVKKTRISSSVNETTNCPIEALRYRWE